MKIEHLFYKSNKDSLYQPSKTIELVENQGISGDLHFAYGNLRHLLIVSQETLDKFNLNPGDLRENLVIDQSINKLKSGQVIQIGQNAKARITFHCEPCYKLEKLQKGLSKKLGLERGIFGFIINSGEIEIDDKITITDQKFPVFSDVAKERFTQFIKNIPTGKVIKTSDLVLGLGVARAYYRVLPSYMKNNPDLPVHRIVSVSGDLFDKHLPNQKELLLSENIEIEDNKVVSDKYFWKPQEFFK